LVLDADALNIIAEEKDFQLIPRHSIITPHPKEFERLFGKTENSFERWNWQRKSKGIQYLYCMKDHHTQVVTLKECLL
jgi:NAD(P)H-hydrate epimerase